MPRYDINYINTEIVCMSRHLRRLELSTRERINLDYEWKNKGYSREFKKVYSDFLERGRKIDSDKIYSELVRRLESKKR